MKQKILNPRNIVAALLVINILDGSFKNLNVLGWIKLLLFAVCLVMMFWKEKPDDES